MTRLEWLKPVVSAFRSGDLHVRKVLHMLPWTSILLMEPYGPNSGRSSHKMSLKVSGGAGGIMRVAITPIVVTSSLLKARQLMAQRDAVTKDSLTAISHTEAVRLELSLKTLLEYRQQSCGMRR